MTLGTATTLYISSSQIVALVRIMLDKIAPTSSLELLIQVVWGGSLRTCIPNKFPGDSTVTGLKTTTREPFLPDTQEVAVIFALPGNGVSLYNTEMWSLQTSEQRVQSIELVASCP